MERYMTLYRYFFAVCALLFTLTSCSAGEDSRIFDYRNSDAQFTVTFPSAYGDVVCDGVKTADCTAFTVREPERSAGVTVQVSGESCVIKANDVEIPLSKEASAGLTCIVAAMYEPLPEPVEASRTSDGANTVITTPFGTLYLDENLLPCAVECKAWNGEIRTVTVTDYVKCVR